MSTATVQVHHPIRSERVEPGDIVTWPSDKAKFYASKSAPHTLPNGVQTEPKPFVTILSADEVAKRHKPRQSDPASFKAPTGEEFQGMLQQAKDNAHRSKR